MVLMLIYVVGKPYFVYSFPIYNSLIASYVYIQYIHIYQKCLVNIVKKVIIDYFACCGKYCPVRYLSSSSISSSYDSWMRYGYHFLNSWKMLFNNFGIQIMSTSHFLSIFYRYIFVFSTV